MMMQAHGTCTMVHLWNMVQYVHVSNLMCTQHPIFIWVALWVAHLGDYMLDNEIIMRCKSHMYQVTLRIKVN